MIYKYASDNNILYNFFFLCGPEHKIVYHYNFENYIPA